MKFKCFIPDCIAGDAKVKDVDAYVEYWHQNKPTETLREFLGMTEYEYSQWGVRSDRIFTEILYCRRGNIDYKKFVAAHPTKPRNATHKACKKVAELSQKCAELKQREKLLLNSNAKLSEQNDNLLKTVADMKDEVECVIKERAQFLKTAVLTNETVVSIVKVLHSKQSYLERQIDKFKNKMAININKPTSTEYQRAKVNHEIASTQLASLKDLIVKVTAVKDNMENDAKQQEEELGTPLEQAMEKVFLELVCKNVLCGSQRCECDHVWLEGCTRYQNFKADLEKLANQHLGMED